MTTYQCYVIDSTYHVDRVMEIECDGDNAARVEADSILAQRPARGIELWRNEKLVYEAQRPGGPRHRC
jgi:hypothetical protein